MFALPEAFVSALDRVFGWRVDLRTLEGRLLVAVGSLALCHG